MERKYAWKPDLPDHRDRIFTGHRQVLNSLPKSVDLRPQMPPVYDQGSASSCTGNAIAAVIHYREEVQKKPNATPPSRLFIYWNERTYEGTTGQDKGAFIRDGIKGLAAYGYCPESLWPYDVSMVTTEPSEFAFRQAVQDRVSHYERVPQELAALQFKLSEGHPVVFGFSVFGEFEGPLIAKTGTLATPTKDEPMMGGHAVLMVGYDNAKQCFIIRNSWGADWGDKGYFYMPYEYALNPGLADDFWTITLV